MRPQHTDSNSAVEVNWLPLKGTRGAVQGSGFDPDPCTPAALAASAYRFHREDLELRHRSAIDLGRGLLFLAVRLRSLRDLRVAMAGVNQNTSHFDSMANVLLQLN